MITLDKRYKASKEFLRLMGSKSEKAAAAFIKGRSIWQLLFKVLSVITGIGVWYKKILSIINLDLNVRSLQAFKLTQEKILYLLSAFSGIFGAYLPFMWAFPPLEKGYDKKKNPREYERKVEQTIRILTYGSALMLYTLYKAVLGFLFFAMASNANLVIG